MSEQEKKKGMSTGLKVGIGCCGALLFFFIIGLIITGKGIKNISSTPVPSSGTQNQTETKKEYTIGDTINLKDHQIVVNSVDPNFSSGNMFDKPQSPDNSFVVVDVSVTNSGSKDLLVNDFGFKLEDETGTQRNITIIAGVEGNLQSVTLSPNGKTSGKLAFEAKKDSSKLILHYSGGISSGGEVTIRLK